MRPLAPGTPTPLHTGTDRPLVQTDGLGWAPMLFALRTLPGSLGNGLCHTLSPCQFYS